MRRIAGSYLVIATPRRRNTGQAALELTIFGGLILFAFASFISYGQRFEAQHELKMETFRRALAKAYNKNSSVSYVLKRDLRPISLFGGYGRGQAQTLGASASVMWQKGIAGLAGQSKKGQDAAFSYYAINDAEMELARHPKQTVGMDGSRQDVMVPYSVAREERVHDEGYILNTAKAENAKGITTTNTATLQDNIKSTVYTRFDSHVNDNPWGGIDYKAPVYEDGATTEQTFSAYRHTDAAQGPIETTATNRIYYRSDGNAPAEVVRTRTVETDNK